MRVRAVGALLLGVALLPCAARAQDLRGIATTTVQHLGIRPLQRDSIPFALAVSTAAGGWTYEGSPISCTVGLPYCVRYVAADVQHASVLTQDVRFTAWGFGVRGLSTTVALRARAETGGFTWPRSDDSFDAMLAYAELERATWRIRLGRQNITGGLGFSGYDGLSAIVDATAAIRVEALAGRSLAKGLYEPRNDALRGLEDFLPDRDAWLFGGSVRLTSGARAVSARYQREIWSDRSGLLSERASLDARTPLAGAMVTGSIDYDFAFARIGKSNLTLSAPLSANLVVEASARRYIPYFELWTIWGFFSPASWNEAEALARWQLKPELSVRARASYRRYGDTHATVVLSELPDHAERGGIGVSARVGSWLIDGDYSIERDLGAFLSNSTLLGRWDATSRFALTLSGTAFQQIEEFRVGEGTVLGGSVAASYDVGRAGIDIGASVYRQNFENRANAPVWNQFRAWTSVRLVFGSDPGTRAGRR